MVANEHCGFNCEQIINHGVFEKLMDDLMDLFKKLFDMSVEEKEELCSGGSSKTCKLYVSGNTNNTNEEVHS